MTTTRAISTARWPPQFIMEEYPPPPLPLPAKRATLPAWQKVIEGY